MEQATDTQNDWQQMPDSTRVWIYQSDRPLTQVEVQEIEAAGARFVADWSSHGAAMEAVFHIFHNRFLVLFADESKAKASGCGIDKSVHFVQALGEALKVDFFDRMRLCYLDNGNVKECMLPDMPSLIQSGELTPETLFFDNLVPDKGSFSSQWTKAMGQGWTARYFI